MVGLALCTALLGCGGGEDVASDSTGASGAGGAAGAGGAGGAGGDPSNGVCALACPTPQACFAHIGAPFDLPSCIAACQREFRGDGWLASEVVGPYFGDLASFGPDTECKLSGVGYAWTSAEKAKYAVKDEARMMSCMTRWNTACGSAATTPESFRSSCFFAYYIYNDAIRAQVSKCLDAGPGECTPMQQCINKIDRGGGDAWLGQLGNP